MAHVIHDDLVATLGAGMKDKMKINEETLLMM
jgi:hypothetical protein